MPFNAHPDREGDTLSNPRALAMMLRRFEILPEPQPFRIGRSARKRGFVIDGRFDDAFQRYGPEGP